jgi:MFS family permease
MAAHPGNRNDTRADARRHAVRVGVVGYFADQYSIILPIIALGPALLYFVPADLDVATKALTLNAIFAATLLGRPVGSLILAPLADRVGRKRVTILSLIGFGVVNILIAVMPGFAAVGGWAIVGLVLLRFIDGMFLAGEYSAAVPLAMEWSKPRLRGRLSGFITMNNPLAYAFLSGVVVLLLSLLPAGDIDSPYVRWGWRIPFFLGALFAFGVALYTARRVVDAPIDGARSVHPLVSLVRGSNRRDFAQTFLMMTGVWLAIQPTLFVLPGLLSSTVGLSPTTTTLVLLVAQLVVAVCYPLAGEVSQRIGRRAFYIVMGLVVSVAASVLFGLAVGTAGVPVWLTFVFVTGSLLATSPLFAPIAAYLTERFGASHRASGYGIAYSIALVIPSFYGLYIDWFSVLVPRQFAPIFLLVIGGVLISVGAALGPETRDAVMGVDGEAPASHAMKG